MRAGLGRVRLPEARTTRVFLGLLVAGALLRLVFFFAWRPAFMGWPDAKSYIDVAHGDLFGNVLRPAGYPLFLRGLEVLVPDIRFVILVNHALGLATAALLYAAVTRATGSRALGLLPAAIVALGGDGMFLEHSPLSEPLFTFLVAVALYAAVRATDGGSLGWPALAGLSLACATSVRVVGLALLPLVVIWLLFAVPRAPLRRRLLTAAAGALAGFAVLGAYCVAEYHAEGEWGLSRNGDWHLYGRVAPFADCTKFTPPPGTAALCESTPRAARPITDAYIFNWWYSPAVRTFDNPFASSPASTAKVGAFARAVILAQPLDYLEEVGAGMLRYVAPNSLQGVGGGPGYDALVGPQILFNPTFQGQGLSSVRRYYGWSSRRFLARPRLVAVLRVYEKVTRVQGPLMVLLALLSFAAPFVTRGRERRNAIMLTLMAWALLTAPVATLEFSARTAVPGFGALAAASALGVGGVTSAVRARRARREPSERGARTAAA